MRRAWPSWRATPDHTFGFTNVPRAHLASSAVMDCDELLSFAYEMLAGAVGDLLREHEDPRTWVFTATHADSPLGEMLLRRHATDGGDAVCVMLPVDTLSQLLEAHAFDASAAERLARWLSDLPAPSHYRVVAIGRDGVAAVTFDAVSEKDAERDENEDEAPASVLRH